MDNFLLKYFIMENTEAFLEPLKYYESSLKDLHRNNVEEYFEQLTKQSGIDVEANHATIKKYNAVKSVIKTLSKSLKWIKFWYGFCIFFIIAGFCGGIGLCVGAFTSKNFNIILLVVGILAILLAIGLIFVLVKAIKPKKKIAQGQLNEKESEAKKLEEEAYAQVNNLNQLFNHKMSIDLVNKSAPLIHLDEYLSNQTVDRIVNQFNSPLDINNDHSTLVVQSGNINTNPFMLRQYFNMTMCNEIYTGTSVITYTRTVSDGNGGTTTQTVTETLVAHVTRPKPTYGVNSELNYYTDAAPNLSFSRSPTNLAGKSAQQIEKLAYKKEKDDSKKAEKALKRGESYTRMANSKFELYFNSTDRDNELEYRLLFTPLAQNNIIYNFSKNDDIYYFKNKCINTIISSHDASMNYDANPSHYYHFDYEQIKNNFISYNCSFFEGIYHDLLLLLSIPIMHQHQSAPYQSNVDNNIISYYEAEALINKLPSSEYTPEGCDTDIILKPTNISKNGIVFIAHGFHADPRIELVPVMGGDGHLHSVPVHYYEYLPVSEAFAARISKDINSLDINSNNIVSYKQFKAQSVQLDDKE